MEMRHHLPSLAAGLGLSVAATILSTPALSQSSGGSDAQLVLSGATIYVSPEREPIINGVVVIRDGKIAAVDRSGSLQAPASAEMLDCLGLTVTAGFWNSHVHFFERKWADVASIPAPELSEQIQETLTRYGFTSVFDLGSPLENTRLLRDRIEAGEVNGPRIRTTGEPLLAPEAWPPSQILRVLGSMTFRGPAVANVEQASTAARGLLDAGVDGIKVHLQRPPPPHPPFPEDAIRAVVSESNRSGRPVFVHPNRGSDIRAAARAGAHVIAHTTPASGPWDDSVLAAVTKAPAALTPTLTLWHYFARHDRISTQRQLTTTAVGQLRAWVASGGAVLFGTDLGAVYYDPSDEYDLMSQAGMTPRQILASLTVAPAERFGDSERLGRVGVGLTADLVVLNGDPLKEVSAFAAVRYTIRDGRVIYRAPD